VSDAAAVQLELAARTDNVAVVRQAVVAAAEALSADAAVVADMKLAVTEACTNVILHAYVEPGGPIEVELLALDRGLTIVVRDHGVGMSPRPPRLAPANGSGLGLGLPLMAAIAEDFEVHGVPGGGTEVRMTFDLERSAVTATAEGSAS